MKYDALCGKADLFGISCPTIKFVNLIMYHIQTQTPENKEIYLNPENYSVKFMKHT